VAAQPLSTRTHATVVTVVVVTYNNRGDIDACLRSLRVHSPHARVVVVDNLSTDGTLDHVRHAYPHVTAVSAGHNGGYGAGVNLGATRAHGVYLAVLNPDTEVEAGWLDALVQELEAHPDVGLVTPTILLTGGGERVNARGNSVHLTGLTFCAGLGEQAPSLSSPAHPVAAVSGAAFVVRRALWDRLGGFDERFFMYLEDTDLSLRARRLGYEILHVPASRVRHRYEVRVSAAKLYHLERNRLLMLRKNLSPTTLALLAPALLLTELLTWAFCLRQGRAYARAKWASYRRVWRECQIVELPQAHGRATQASDRDLLGACSSRLALEHVASSSIATGVNAGLTAFYTLSRDVAMCGTAVRH